MSRIVRQLECDNCKKEYKDLFISFGQPIKDFDYKWKCSECGHINTLHIENWYKSASEGIIKIDKKY